MVILPNYVYSFTFTSVFNTLDGIYKVESINSYSELLNNKIDLYKVTYSAYGATDDQFRADLDLIREGKTAKLVSVDDESVIIYIPEHLFAEIPNGDVHNYYLLGLAVNIGIFDDIELVNNIKNEVDQIVSTMTGTENKTTIFNVKSKWMTLDEYQVIDDERKDNITRITNHYTEKQELLKQIDSLKTLIKYYEDLLISQQ